MREIDERVKKSGKYEIGTIVLRDGDEITTAEAKRLAKAATALNQTIGNPCE